MLFSKRYLMLIIIISILIMCWNLLQAQFAGGSGTADDPWQIATASHLNNIRSYISYEGADKHYVQIADINLGVLPWNEGSGWFPITAIWWDIWGEMFFLPFVGSYDGGIYTISGLTINWSSWVGGGLFMEIRDSELRNIKLINVNVTNESGVGALFGYGWRSNIINCSAEGSVNGPGYVGGLFGNIGNSQVSYCSFQGEVVSTGSLTGGLGGQVGSSKVSYSYSKAMVSGTYDVGGLFGNINVASIGKTVENCYSSGNVSGQSYTGGLIGSISGNVYGIPYEVKKCFSTGLVSGTGDHIGGLVGSNPISPVTNSYWDMTVSGQTTSAGGEGRTTAEMTYPHSPNTYVDWDFTRSWSEGIDQSINDGYPHLRWQTEPLLIAEPDSLNCFIPQNAELIKTVLLSNFGIGEVFFEIEIVGGERINRTRPGWINSNLDNGTLNTDESLRIEFLFDSTGLDTATYSADIIITTSYDVDVIIPVSLLVIPGFSGGSGTANDPWQISFAEQLNNLRYFLGSQYQDNHFIQTADIDLGSSPWNEGEGWEPIGWYVSISNNLAFNGEYNGNGFVIDGLYINRTDIQAVGLFSVFDNALINNITLTNANVTGGSEYTGILSGVCMSGTIINDSSVSGIVSGINSVGGIVGRSYESVINYSHSNSDVYGVDYVGGLAGQVFGHDNEISELNGCYTSGNVSGNNFIGGLIGYSLSAFSYPRRNDVKERIWEKDSPFNNTLDRIPEKELYRFPASINNSYSTSQISGYSYIGGLIGRARVTNVRISYSEGPVIGTGNYVGGLIGDNHGSRITNCYSNSDVIGMNYSGGLVGISHTHEYPGWAWFDVRIINCRSSGDVEGANYVGGLAGYNNYHALVSSSYSNSNVSGLTYVGGLLGRSSNNSTVINTFSRGTVTALEEYAGGLIGLCQSTSVQKSYSSSMVTGTEYVGGFVGSQVNSAFTDCYWDIDVSGQNESAAGEGRTTEEMTYPYAPNTYVDWNFETIWFADPKYLYNNGYPYVTGTPLSAEEEILPRITAELVIYPNPFNPETTIRLTNYKSVPDELIIFNIIGQRVRSIDQFEKDKDGFFYIWDGKNDQSRSVSSGVYFAVIRSEGKILHKAKMMLLK